MQRAYATIFAVIGWFAVIGQYFATHPATLAGAVDYLSYFTIESNVLVAATFTAAAIAPQSAIGRFLLRPKVAVATALYIAVTCIVYYFLLSGLLHLNGWTLRFDHLLHYVMPPAYLIFWLLFIPRGSLHLRTVPVLLIFPLLYGAYTLVHGAFTGFYPYPFVDVAKLGYQQVFRNIVGFVIFFSLVGSILVLIDRTIALFGKNRIATPARA